MIAMIAYSKGTPEHIRDPPRGPDHATKAVCFSSTLQEGWYRGSLLCGQARRSARRRMRPHGLATSFPSTPEPLAHCPSAHAQDLSDRLLFPAELF